MLAEVGYGVVEIGGSAGGVIRPTRTRYGAGRMGFSGIFHGRLPRADSDC
jgi:hypothetical protein